MNSQKIYKAIQKGLNEALAHLSIDDFDEVETVNNEGHEEINAHSGKEEYEHWKFIKDNFVDLDLPSGLLWAKHNLGATCGDTPESWYGHYYMWGSTKSNDNDSCTWSTTPFNNGNDRCQVNWYKKFGKRFLNGVTLKPEYDAAHVENPYQRIPSIEEIQELFDYTHHKYVERYNGIDDLNGYEFIGKNGNSIFIPAEGYRIGRIVLGDKRKGYIWSNSLYVNDAEVFEHIALMLSFDDRRMFPDGESTRDQAVAIRAVSKKW